MQDLNKKIENFKTEVGLKFQLYNGLFTALPFHHIENTGVLLSMFLSECEAGFKAKKSASTIVEQFFKKHTKFTKIDDQQNVLFRFIQYAERQVVLFDAVEDAAFGKVNDVNGTGSVSELLGYSQQFNKNTQLITLLQKFSVSIILTAHPTQFYPDSVLGIINDLTHSLEKDEAANINQYLQQLGKTPFLKKQKPTPYDEATSLIWFLENVFYKAIGQIHDNLQKYFATINSISHPVVKLGFWPGGDRDGNPFVNAQTTRDVAAALNQSILKLYYNDIHELRKRLTFEGIEQPLANLSQKLYDTIYLKKNAQLISSTELFHVLQEVKNLLVEKHRGIYLHLLESFMNKVSVFGTHFATLDVRQDSSVHESIYAQLEAQNRIPAGFNTDSKNGDSSVYNKLKLISLKGFKFENPQEQDCFDVVKTIKDIQNKNGEQGCHRYIISHATSAESILQVLGIFIMSGYNKHKIPVDIVPLFETIEDLQNAPEVMEKLYHDPLYKKHLAQRKNKQTIMVGFSDGTKDGGYLMANWGIYTAKIVLTEISRSNDIDVVFFDGRGGPPARGGGKSHRFYASMGNDIANDEIQLTIQGQTISSNFGTPQSATFNIEQLINAGISNKLKSNLNTTFSQEESQLLDELSKKSFESYQQLKLDPLFLQYLQHASPLEFYGQTNIGSRPAKRGKATKLSLSDLRAIPFVGAWSQIKQNVTGFYGVGTALQHADKTGKMESCKALYKRSLFFKTMIDNCEMAMKKCFFELTAHLSKDPTYGQFWNTIYNEFELTKKYLTILTGNESLMEEFPIDQMSIQMRERIMLPLLTIQQHAIMKYNAIDASEDKKSKIKYGKLVMRCSFGIINAGRNSA